MKIPVPRVVTRGGNTHIQTYWESDGADALSGTSIPAPTASLPQTTPSTENPDVRNSWIIVMGETCDDKVDALIAAGYTFGAHEALIRELPEGVNVAEWIYDHGLDQLPHPDGGWRHLGAHGDQRTLWEEAGVGLEATVEWINAGFTYPSEAVQQAIKEGMSSARAKEWVTDLQSNLRWGQATGKSSLHLKYVLNEIRGGIPLDEAKKWRAELNPDKSIPTLNEVQVEMHNAGFTVDEARRWSKVTGRSVTVKEVEELRSLKWSPTAIKSMLKDFYGYSNGSAVLQTLEAQELTRITPLVGSAKIVKEWAESVRRDGRAFDNMTIRGIRQAEDFKTRFKNESGVAVPESFDWKVMNMLPLQREAAIEIMTSESRNKSTDEVFKALDIGSVVGSVDNLRFLKERGFTFDVLNDNSKSFRIAGGYDVFQPTKASKQEQDRWMRSMAVSLYATVSNAQSFAQQWINDETLDPIVLRDTLIRHDGRASELHVEAASAGISGAVEDGWL